MNLKKNRLESYSKTYSRISTEFALRAFFSEILREIPTKIYQKIHLENHPWISSEFLHDAQNHPGIRNLSSDSSRKSSKELQETLHGISSEIAPWIPFVNPVETAVRKSCMDSF